MSSQERRTVYVGSVDGRWVVQAHKWSGDRLVWSGNCQSYSDLPAATAAAEWKQRNRVAAGQSCSIQMCPEAMEATS